MTEWRTPVGDRLHAAVDALVTALSVDDAGELLANPEETDARIEAARVALVDYCEAEADERTPEGDVLAQALQVLLDWPKPRSAGREDFKVILYALEMSRYQYGGPSQYLDP